MGADAPHTERTASADMSALARRSNFNSVDTESIGLIRELSNSIVAQREPVLRIDTDMPRT